MNKQSALWLLAVSFVDLQSSITNGRPPEGRILTREEIEAIGYTWGLLTRDP
jgi:hypothetical protein